MDGTQQQDWHEARAVRADLESEARAELAAEDAAERSAQRRALDAWGGPLGDYGDDDEG